MAFPKESHPRQSRATQHTVRAGCSNVSITHGALTGITASLTCLCDLCACVYTRDLDVCSLPEGLLWGKQSAHNWTPGKLARQTEHEAVTHPCGEHAQRLSRGSALCAADSPLPPCGYILFTIQQLFTVIQGVSSGRVHE